MRVFLTELCNVTKQDLERLAATLPADRLAKAQRHNGSLDPQSVIGFCLVRYAVAQIAPNADAEHWLWEAKGKPTLAEADLHFSLTHTDRAVAVAVAHEAVGIDLEQIRPHPPRFAKRYFSDAEQVQIASAPDYDSALCRLWTAKEAVGKRLGTGLSDMRSIDTANVQSLSLSLGEVPHWLSVSPAPHAPLQIEPIAVSLLE